MYHVSRTTYQSSSTIGDIALLKTYGIGPYTNAIKAAEDDIKKHQDKVKELIGIKESDTGLSLPSQWDLVADKQMMQVLPPTPSILYSLLPL
jgi:26S proteasome regulatory subunit T1